MAFADLTVKQHITSICEALCRAADLRLISAGIDKYGSSAWEMGGHNHLNRYLMFSLTEAEEIGKPPYAEIVGGIDNGSRFAEVVRRGWPFVGERSVTDLTDWIVLPILHLTTADNELTSVKLLLVRPRSRPADEPEDIPRFAPEIGTEQWMTATLAERLAWCWNTVAVASERRLIEQFILPRTPPAEERERSRNL